MLSPDCSVLDDASDVPSARSHACDATDKSDATEVQLTFQLCEREINLSLGGHPGEGAKSLAVGENGGGGGGGGGGGDPPFSDDDPERTRNETTQQTQHKSVEPGLTGCPAPRRSHVSI